MGTRIVAFLLAGLFLLTSVGFSAFTIYEANNEEETPTVSSSEVTDIVNQAQQDNLNQEQDVEPVALLQNFEPSDQAVSEIQIIDTVVGEGQAVVASDTVTVNYTGALVSDGSIFDSSDGSPITFGLDNLIEGWKVGIPGMQPGGTRRLVIPAAQAYGPSARPGIPANSDLVFDIELIGIAQ